VATGSRAAPVPPLPPSHSCLCACCLCSEQGGWGDDDIKEGEEWDDSGQSDRVMLTADADAPSLSRQSSYRILDNESLLSTQNKLVAQNAEVLFVSPAEAALLLRHYGWKSKKLQAEWFENQKKVRETVGITSAEDGKASRAGIVNGRVQCQSAYCDEVEVSQAHALHCGHWFCSSCWTAYLTSQINDGQKSVFTHCMGMRCELEHAHKFGCSCGELVPEAVFSKYVTDSRLLDKYRRWLLDSFVEGQRHIKCTTRSARQ
jgi:ariadne-1